ncbi:MAG: hypothetical protein IKG85_02320 [Clostridia bacterium]|nr:hypothetical protein [Clostridia bacterium]
MKRVYKKIISAALALLTLFTLAGCSGRSVKYLDEDVFEKFTSAISKLDFEAAFGWISEKSKTPPAPAGDAVETASPTADPAITPEPDRFVTKEAFIEKYTNIFDGVGVTGVSFDKLSVKSVNNERRVIKYNATYSTEKYGDITNEYEMNVVADGEAWRVEWTPALIFPDMTWGSTVRVTTVAANRGDILASGELLAETVTLHAVTVKLSEIEAYDDFALEVSEILPVDPMDVMNSLQNAKGESALVCTVNERELTPDMREAIDKNEALTLVENYGTDRWYPLGETLAHTIGYVGYVSEEELPALNEGRTETDGLYTTHSIVGRSGIERAYETTLRGRDGLNITVRDANGEYVSTVYRKPVEHGSDVHLTIDLDMQRRAEEVMDLVLWGDDTAGAVICMNPKTGEVKTMLSYPSYDLNKLAISADRDYYDSISKQKNRPLQNRATLGLYAPGSSFKILTAAAGLEMGYVTPDYVFTGEIKDDYWTPTGYGTWVWPPIKRTEIKKRREPMNMENCLLHSDNIYFANLALMMGEDAFFQYLRKVGLEQSFPFELSVAKSTLKTRFETEELWNLRSIAETGYGQGQVTISPIQLAATYCAFRNGGNIPTPRLTSALYRTEGIEYAPVQTFETKTWISGAFQPNTIDTLIPMMENIMSRDYNGTGKRLRARGVTVAGKTGTAEIGSDKSREISWFVGFRVGVEPEDELLVLVMLEIPTADEYKYLKFDIARELISMEDAVFPFMSEEPAESPEPMETPETSESPLPAGTEAPSETEAPENTDGPISTEGSNGN